MTTSAIPLICRENGVRARVSVTLVRAVRTPVVRNPVVRSSRNRCRVVGVLVVGGRSRDGRGVAVGVVSGRGRVGGRRWCGGARTRGGGRGIPADGFRLARGN